MSKESFAKVASVIDEHEVVINKGSKHGVSLNDEFVIYKLGDEVIDPDTQESLGQLEVILGKAIAVHVQEKMTTIRSNEYTSAPNKTEIKKIVKNSVWSSLNGDSNQEITTTTPGEKKIKKLGRVVPGCLVSRINS